jgi:hypothetical protein
MNEPLDELYLSWLYAQVLDYPEPKGRNTYWSLLRQLYKTEFIWFIPNDDNRVNDGKYLRYEFCENVGIFDVDQDWFEMGCSVLEMLVALSRRLSFQTEDPAHIWFWQLMHNLRLDRYNDRSGYSPHIVSDILDNVIWRTYAYDGEGGLFPLQNPERDQRKVEIWYQMAAYLIERMD